MPLSPTRTAVLGMLALVLLGGCGRKAERGEPPPAPTLQSPCEGQALGPSALAPDLPVRAAGHCVDPRIDVRSYGVGAKAPLDSVCTELFNGECELYKTYGLEGVRTLEYAPSVGDHAVSVVVSEFRTGPGAFGFLTRRILAGGPPEGLTVEPLELAGQGALGASVAYLRRGRRVVELTYVSPTETPQEVEAKSKRILPELARAIALELGGDEALPSVAQRVALTGVLPLGLELPPDGLFGLTGTGPHAIAHFGGTSPHRLLAVEAVDEPSAKDTWRLLATAGALRKVKGSDVVTLRVSDEGRPPEEWFLLRQGRLIVGVGPALGKGAPPLPPGDARDRAEAAWTAFARARLAEAMKHAERLGP